MGDDARSDEALLVSGAGGDDAAFAELMRRHEDRTFALCVRMLGDRADALEATQETFVAAYRRAGSFRGESAFGTWLYRIAINTCRDFLRKRRRTSADELPDAPVPDPATRVDETASARVDVARALAAIPEQYRESVVMHDLGGISYDEIAHITGTNIGTIKSRISRGRRMLAGLLEQQGVSGTSKE